MNEAQKIHQALGYGTAPVNSKIPQVLPPVVQHTNPKRNAERKLVKAIGRRQFKKQRIEVAA